MIFEDRYGNIIISEELDQLSPQEIERRGLHVVMED